MKLTSHKTRSVFDRYDIVTESDLRRAIGRLDVWGEEQKANAEAEAEAAAERKGKVAPFQQRSASNG